MSSREQSEIKEAITKQKRIYVNARRRRGRNEIRKFVLNFF